MALGAARPVESASVFLLCAGLSAVDLLLCFLMIRQSTGGRFLPGCGAESGCDAVTRSRWSRWLDISVATPGAVLYGAILCCSLLVSMDRGPSTTHYSLLGLLASLPLLFGTAVWFTAVQLFVVRRLCPYCMLLHAISVALAAIILQETSLSQSHHAHPLWVLTPGLVGLFALLAGQLLFKPRMYAVTCPAVAATSMPGENRDSVRSEAGNYHLHKPCSTAAAPSPANPYAGKVILVVRGRIALPGGNWPVRGAPQSKQHLVFLFDYTCANCRRLHRLMREAMRHDRASLAMTMVPIPLDPACNPLVLKPDRLHINACAYARLALAVWNADWTRYATFDDLLFEDDKPPPLSIARQRAQELCANEILDPALPDPQLDRIIRAGLNVYRSLRLKQTPALLLPHGVLTGVPSPVEFRAVVNNHLVDPSQGAPIR